MTQARRSVSETGSSEHDKPMALILFKLELLSFGATQSFNKSGGGSSDPTDRMVTAVLRLREVSERPLHLHYRDLYNRQHSDIGRKAVYEEAESAWSTAVKREAAPTDENAMSFEDVVLEDGKGWSAEDVAQHFRIDPAFVRRIRERHKRSMESGLPLIAVSETDPAKRAVELLAKGYSTRQVATELGTNQSQVMRWIRAAA